MSKERLVIKNFGPIKSVDLELGKMTILIGEQATGKSTIAKVLAMCKYFSNIVECKYNWGYNTEFDDGLRYWGIFEYLNEDTYIEYHCNEYKLHINYEIKDWEYNTNENGEAVGESYPAYAGAVVYFDWVSEKFQNLLNKLEEIKPWNNSEKKLYGQENSEWYNWYPDIHFFNNDVNALMKKPVFLPVERNLQGISFSKDLLLSEATQDQLRKISRIYISRGTQPLPFEELGLSFKRENSISYIKKENEQKFYQLSKSASGYQSIMPIAIAIKYYTEFLRTERNFIIEEIELSLFPKMQQKLIEYIIPSIYEKKCQFLLPTHSPYILSSLNNLLYAYKVAHSTKAKSEVDAVIKEKYWLNPDDVEVYYLENGGAKTLINKEDGLINIDDLDSVSEIINKEFDKLIAIEIQHSKEVENGV